jgi:ribulose-phosphate 3-epimerase
MIIDAADEVDPDWNMIKGGGGALLREKIVAQASRREVIVVNHTKLSGRLGIRHSMPVEVAPFGGQPEALRLEALGATVSLRRDGYGSSFRTDQGNLILDAEFGPIENLAELAASLLSRGWGSRHRPVLRYGHRPDRRHPGQRRTPGTDAVMNGPITFGPGSVVTLAPTVHATRGMVENPDRYAARFVGTGADVITVLAEACRQLHWTIETILAAGHGAGIALNPATSPEAAEEILTDVDLALVMTVNPGFGGQELIPPTPDKVYRIADPLSSRDVSSVDGEVDEEIQKQTIGMAVSAGASVAVAGSAIFDVTSPVAACVASLRDSARCGPRGRSSLRALLTWSRPPETN